MNPEVRYENPDYLVRMRWLLSYFSADRTTTYSVYEGPSKAAVRAAASANGTSIDGITEVPLIVPPK